MVPENFILNPSKLSGAEVADPPTMICLNQSQARLRQRATWNRGILRHRRCVPLLLRALLLPRPLRRHRHSLRHRPA